MERSDEVGAAAAAGYFMELFAYVMQTGDLEEWDRISAQDCGFCQNTRERIVDVYGDGGRFSGGELRAGTVEHLGYDAVLGVHAAGLNYEFGSGAELAVDGSTVAEMGDEEGYAIVDVVFASGGWVLLGASLSEGTPS